ncbi:hypothetical protein BSL82_03690 [Tardibacter chloracetimidivorans]|uniref:Uncharacterized protein n=1 Tax=Tardibacter chloracetimidivorans TaxID=1921510 RepID=A0A1L3ZSC2_9SPHN|nr:hypothetical protein [Tardibacter chloracetimidivorans]API58519.1 hypothetical protein BSL82_03690 [Tardibacter chloracetimidivorans]
MADPLKERISLLQMGAAQGKLKPEHQAELDRYTAQGLVKGAQPGVDRDDIQSRISLRQAGMPAVEPIRDPFLRIENPKVREETKGRMMANGAKVLEKAQPEIDKARNALASYDEFSELNDRVRPTGGLINRGFNAIRETFGDSDLSRMEQLSLAMARSMRQPGEGPVSDWEGRIFAKMSGGYNRPYATNEAFIEAGKALSQRQIDMQQFREAYLQANGTLVGSDTEWAKYREANPIINRDGTVRKAQHWSDWYSSQMNRALERRKALKGAPPSTRKGAKTSGRVVYDINGNPIK